MRGGEVHEVVGHAVLGGHRDAGREQPVAYVRLERAERRLVGCGRAEAGTARLGVLEVRPQQPHPVATAPGRVHVDRPERTDQRHPPAGARHGDVQPPVATGQQQRAEPVQQPALGVLAVPYGQDDRVAFVALYPFEVLHEERLRTVFGEERVQVRPAGQRPAQRGVDALGVRDAHRDDAQRLVRPGRGMLRGERHDPLDLGRDAVGGLCVPGGLFDVNVRDAPRPGGPREGDQRPVVHPRVGEPDQPLVLAAVVPAQRVPGQQRGQHVENRLVPARQRQVDLAVGGHAERRVVGFVGDGEERGRRQLVLVARDHDLARAQDRRYRVGGRHLARLVEHHDVEVPGVGGQQLRHDERAHGPARLQRGEHVRRGGEQLPDRQVPALQVGLVLHEAALVRVLLADPHDVLRYGPQDAGGAGVYVGVVRGAVVGGEAAVHVAVERADARVGEADMLQDRGVPAMVEAGHRAGRVGAGRPHFGQQRGEAEPVEVGRQFGQAGQPAQRALVGHQRADEVFGVGRRERPQVGGGQERVQCGQFTVEPVGGGLRGGIVVGQARRAAVA